MRGKKSGVPFPVSPLRLHRFVTYLLLPCRDMAGISLKRRKFSIQPTNQLAKKKNKTKSQSLSHHNVISAWIKGRFTGLIASILKNFSTFSTLVKWFYIIQAKSRSQKLRCTWSQCRWKKKKNSNVTSRRVFYTSLLGYGCFTSYFALSQSRIINLFWYTILKRSTTRHVLMVLILLFSVYLFLSYLFFPSKVKNMC